MNPKAWADDRFITNYLFWVVFFVFLLKINLRWYFLWAEISHSSSSSFSCNNEFSSWNLSSRSHHSEAPWEHATVNFLICSYLNPELINTHSGRLCCCSASPSRETNQTMGVIERQNRWHYWILITSFSRQRRTWQLPGYKTHACVSVYRKGLERKADDWLIRFSQRLKEGHKWLSAHPTLSGWIPPVTAWRAPSIWRGA